MYQDYTQAEPPAWNDIQRQALDNLAKQCRDLNLQCWHLSNKRIRSLEGRTAELEDEVKLLRKQLA